VAVTAKMMTIEKKDSDGEGEPPVTPACASKQPLKLESMPPEILTLILEYLIPEQPEIGETRPVAYDKLMADEPWYHFTRCRRGLNSLCRVSRRMAALARPCLYRTIALWNEASMFLLFRTLLEKPEYGVWTRFLSCHLTLSRKDVIREMRRLLVKYGPTLKFATGDNITVKRAKDFIELFRTILPLTSANLDYVPQIILYLILTFLTRLEVHLLQVPICDDEEEYDVFCRHMSVARALYPEGAPETPFTHVHTLQLQGDPELLSHFEDEDCNCEIPEIWGTQPRRYARLFSAFPNLTTLEVSSDDGIWSNELYDWDPDFHHIGGDETGPYLKGIRHIFLHNSGACPTDLYHLLVNAPQLETLYMAPCRDGYDRDNMVDENSMELHPEALDVALSQHAKHLRNLDVSWHDVSGFEPLIGPEGGRLASLATMGTLEKLCIQMAMLYGTPANVATMDLIDLLPPNLIELALEDWWWHNASLLYELPHWDARRKIEHYTSQQKYRASALKTLSQFARDVRVKRLHKLKKVKLVCKIPWTWMMEDAVPLEFHFEDIKNMLLAKGIDFEVSSDEIEELKPEDEGYFGTCPRS